MCRSLYVTVWLWSYRPVGYGLPCSVPVSQEVVLGQCDVLQRALLVTTSLYLSEWPFHSSFPDRIFLLSP